MTASKEEYLQVMSMLSSRALPGPIDADALTNEWKDAVTSWESGVSQHTAETLAAALAICVT